MWFVLAEKLAVWSGFLAGRVLIRMGNYFTVHIKIMQPSIRAWGGAMRKSFTLFLLALALLLLLGAQPAMTIMPYDGRTLVAERCTTCHNLDRVERRFGQDLAFWESTVDRMLGKRNMLSDAERKAVLAYLINP